MKLQIFPADQYGNITHEVVLIPIPGMGVHVTYNSPHACQNFLVTDSAKILDLEIKATPEQIEVTEIELETGEVNQYWTYNFDQNRAKLWTTAHVRTYEVIYRSMGYPPFKLGQKLKVASSATPANLTVIPILDTEKKLEGFSINSIGSIHTESFSHQDIQIVAHLGELYVKVLNAPQSAAKYNRRKKIWETLDETTILKLETIS